MTEFDDLYRLVWNTYPGPDRHQYLGTKNDIFALHYALTERANLDEISVYDMEGNEYEVEDAKFVQIDKQIDN